MNFLFCFCSGVLLAILEKLGYILPICSEDGFKIDVTPGTKRISIKISIIQWKPLNVITVGQTESDNTNRMLTKSDLLLIHSFQ